MENSIAYEMLQEIKRSNKRWFIISIVELVVIICIVAGVFVYESQYNYSDEVYTQETYDVESSEVTQSIN